MPRHSRSRSPRRQDHQHDDRDRDNYRERYRKRSPFSTKRRLNSRSKSPIIRGPSGVKSKNAVNELLLAETVKNEEMMGSAGRIDKDNGQADFRNSESFRKPSGFGNNGGYRTERSGRGGRNFGRGSNQNFGRDRNNFGENRSFRGGRGRPMHGQSDRGRGARRDGPPRREWDEERRTERYKEEDKNKPVLQLVNPTHVPRGRNYFEHDNRDAEQEDEPRFTRPRGGRRFEDDRFSRDRERDRRKDGKMYDPRFDFSSSSRNIRDRLSTASGYEKNSAPLGWRNSNFSGANERREKTRTRDDFSHFRQRSSSIEKWTHDKFNEVLHEKEVEGKNIELVEKDSHEEKDGQEELPTEGRVTVVTTENSTRKVTVRE